MGYSEDILNDLWDFLNDNLDNPTSGQWIYFDFTRISMDAPRIIIYPLSEMYSDPFIGSTHKIIHQLVEITIFSNTETVTYDGNDYSAFHFAHFIIDEIAKLLMSNKALLQSSYGWNDVAVQSSKIERYDFYRELYAKTIRIRITKVV